MLKKITLFIIVFICWDLFGSNEEMFDAEIYIQSEKEVYFIYESIFIKFKIVNNSTVGPRINRVEYFTNFRIIDSDGTKYPSLWHISVLRDKIEALSVGDIIEKEFMDLDREVS